MRRLGRADPRRRRHAATGQPRWRGDGKLPLPPGALPTLWQADDRYMLKAGAGRDHSQLQAELVQMVGDQIGPVAVFKQTKVVARLPKTRSGKILRATMRRIADGQKYTVPPTSTRSSRRWRAVRIWRPLTTLL